MVCSKFFLEKPRYVQGGIRLLPNRVNSSLSGMGNFIDPAYFKMSVNVPESQGQSMKLNTLTVQTLSGFYHHQNNKKMW
jgi:hypothetical protein